MPVISRRSPWEFQAEEFERVAASMGVTDDAGRARLLGMDQGFYSRVKKGQATPGPSFMARVKRALPALPLEQFFRLRNGDAA